MAAECPGGEEDEAWSVQANYDSDSSDDAWAHELCHAPRKSLHATISDSSDDAWLQELCRGTGRSIGSSGVAVSHELDLPSRSSGVAVSPELDLPTRDANEQPKPFAGPYKVMSQLVSELEDAWLRLPSPLWSLPSQDTILWDTQESRCSGVIGVPVLSVCLWRVAAWCSALRVAIFKIGIAYDPKHRWWNDEFGYDTEQTWMFMDVMHHGTVEECRSLEIDLIARLQHLPGCYNVKPGGEGISAHSSTSSSGCYCYAVYAPAGSGVSIRVDWRKRKLEVAE